MVPFSVLHSRVELSNEIPTAYQQYRIEGSKILSGEAGSLYSLFQYFHYPEFSVYFTDLFSKEAERLLLERTPPVFFLAVQLKNSLGIKVDGLEPILLHERSFNFFEAPTFQVEVAIAPETSAETFFVLVPQAFVSHLAMRYPMVIERGKGTSLGQPRQLMPDNKSCSPDVLRIIEQIRTAGPDILSSSIIEKLLMRFLDLAF